MKDTLVVPRSADYIDKHMSSPFRQIAYSPESSHGLLLDDERERLVMHSGFLLTLGQYGHGNKRAAGSST